MSKLYVFNIYFDTNVFLVREAAAGPRRRLMSGHTTEELDDLSDDLPPITSDDFTSAIENTKPTVSSDIVERHTQWNLKFGSA